ncbi:hypothetical protein [Streptomyces arenae]|uniref:hypothetical protein n=1 Tax=Streptomyces arenae TaxID=29301 RepID=UPI00265AB587|nr:hypothetical protein [Streptomyces arenae]MCG7202302.1 hypothetical protein [Streptomyces arenae]
MTVIGVTAVIALNGCSGTGNPAADTTTATRTAPLPRGVITRTEAVAVVDHYEEVNAQANKTQNAELLGTVEGGQLYEQSKADYQFLPTWPKRDQAYYKKAFSYRDRSYYIPEGQSWFAVKATASGSRDQALLVFDKTTDRHFKMVAAVYRDSTSPIPAIDTGNHGLATAVAPSTRVGALAPDQIAGAFEDLYTTGGKNAGTQLASTTATRSALKTYRERTSYRNAKYATLHWETAQPTKPRVYALRLRDGGAVVVFPTAHNRMEQLKDGHIYKGYIKLVPGAQQAVFDKTPRVAILDELQGQALAALTPSGKAAVLGVEYRMVDSR